MKIHRHSSGIGTTGGSPRKLIDRERFEKGLEELVRVLRLSVIININNNSKIQVRYFAS